MIVWDDGKWVDLKLISEKCEESNSAVVYGNHIVTDKRECSGIKQFGLDIWLCDLEQVTYLL